MKHNISRISVSFSIFLVMILLLTKGLHAEGQKCIDVSGTWSGTEEIDNSDCGFPNQTISYTYELIQDGCNVTVKGEELKAVVRGDRIYWPPRSIPGRPAGFTVTLEAGVSQVSGNKATGGRSWTRTDGIKSCSGTIVWTDVKLPPKDTESASNVPAPAHRERLTVNELFGDKYEGDGPVKNDYFMPLEDAAPALHEFSGTLVIASTKMTYHYIWARGRENLGPFPALKANFFTYQEHLVPIERNKLLKSEKGSWYIILAPGRIWSEPGDKGYSRASFPFTLIHSKSLYSKTHNGIATFLFNDKHVSALRFQIVQEAAPREKFDAWGQADMKYLPSPLPDKITLTKRFVNELTHQTPIRSWTELEQTYDPNADLWSLITREVFEPIGITRMPVLRTKEPNHAPGIPKLEGGMLPNLDEVAKLVKLLSNGGRHQGEQILSATKLDEAIGKARPPGLPTGWRIDDGETYYHMSLWLHPFVAKSGCRLRIPAMSGGGGTYVIIMPNGITAFRFADGRYTDPGTWDSSGLRKVADYIRPFYKKPTK